MLVVGSQALAIHARLRGIPFRRPTDLDITCTTHDMIMFCERHALRINPLSPGHWIAEDDIFGHIEFETVEEFPSSQMYLDHCKPWPNLHMNVLGEDIDVPPTTVLYSMKRSHRHFARQWEKHIHDYHLLKSMVNGIDALAEITKLRTAETKKAKTPSLNKTKDEFFEDDVSNHTFIHDDIHEVMRHRGRPMFEYIKVDADKVTCSKEKFDALLFKEQMWCVLEEAYVIALERGIIPMLYEGKKLADSESALKWALMRICTTLCSGWFREFATDNYPEIWRASNPCYVEKFLRAVDEGRVNRIKK